MEVRAKICSREEGHDLTWRHISVYWYWLCPSLHCFNAKYFISTCPVIHSLAYIREVPHFLDSVITDSAGVIRHIEALFVIFERTRHS